MSNDMDKGSQAVTEPDPTRYEAEVRPIDRVKMLFDKMVPQIEAVLGDEQSARRVIRAALTSCRKTPELLECNVYTLLGAVMELGQMNLEPDTPQQLAHLVPYRGRVVPIIGYRGYARLAYNSGQIQNIEMRTVRRGDEFDYALGDAPFITHRPLLPGEDAEGNVVSDPEEIERLMALRAYYCVVHFAGTDLRHRDVMSIAEVNVVKMEASGSTHPSSPWQRHPEAMGMKTVVRRALKLVPNDTIQRAVAIDEMVDAGIDPKLAAHFFKDSDMPEVDVLTSTEEVGDEHQ